MLDGPIDVSRALEVTAAPVGAVGAAVGLGCATWTLPGASGPKLTGALIPPPPRLMHARVAPWYEPFRLMTFQRVPSPLFL